jgi:PAS domain-containing protein
MEITNFRSHLLMASALVTLHIRQAQNAFVKVRTTVVDKFQGLGEAIRATGDDLENLRSQPSRAPRSMTVHLQGVRKALGKLRNRVVVDKPQKLHQAIGARANDLPTLLEGSPDAVVALNTDFRFVAANPKALHLFGISERNLKMFAMDAFLSRAQIFAARDEGSRTFISRREWHGECRIRRLDGSLRVAGFIFVANYLPFLHLCMFRNDRKWQSRERFAA